MSSSNQISLDQNWATLANSIQNPGTLEYNRSTQSFQPASSTWGYVTWATGSSDASHLAPGLATLIDKTKVHAGALRSQAATSSTAQAQMNTLRGRVTQVKQGLAGKTLGELSQRIHQGLSELDGLLSPSAPATPVRKAAPPPPARRTLSMEQQQHLKQAMSSSIFDTMPSAQAVLVQHDPKLANAVSESDALVTERLKQLELGSATKTTTTTPTAPPTPLRRRPSVTGVTDFIPEQIRPKIADVQSFAKGSFVKTMEAMHHYDKRFSEEQIAAMVLAGNKLLKMIQSGTADSIPASERKEAMTCFVWMLMAQAHQRNKAFGQGMFDIADPHHRIHDFFAPVSYTRGSSHYKGRTDLHRGVDCTREGYGQLPNALRTAVFAKLDPDTKTGASARLYLKPENWGADLTMQAPSWGGVASSLGEALLHGTDFIQTRFVAPSQAGFQKEHLPKEYREKALKIFQLVKAELLGVIDLDVERIMHDVDTYGLSAIADKLAQCKKELRKLSYDMEAQMVLQRVASFEAELESRFGSKWRDQKGDEVLMNQSMTPDMIKALLNASKN